MIEHDFAITCQRYSSTLKSHDDRYADGQHQISMINDAVDGKLLLSSVG